MRVLIINTSERIGGAAIAANRLMQGLKKNGVKARMLVRDKQTDQLTVVSIGYGWTQPIKFLWERVSIFAANKFSKRNLFLVDIANEEVRTSFAMRKAGYICVRRTFTIEIQARPAPTTPRFTIM